jgi:hypothetical protein
MNQWLSSWLLLASGCVPGAVPHESPKACGLELHGDCRTCADSSCCAELTACSAARGCKMLAQCLADCEDAKCRAACSLEYPVGETREASELAACLARSCEEECELPCGALVGIAAPVFADDCQTCLSTSFCEDARACAGDAACQAYITCRRQCDTGDCIAACLSGHAASIDYCLGDCASSSCLRPCGADFDAVVDLSSRLYEDYIDAKCRKQCGALQDWSCDGTVRSPTIRGRERRLTVAFDVFLSHVNGDIRVQMCQPTDRDCETPVSEGTTDADGVVHLVDATDTENGTGNGLIGFLKVSAERLYPTRVYWGFRLSEEDGALSIPIPVFTSSHVKNSLKGGGGILAAVAVDCAGTQAEGIKFSLDMVEAPRLGYSRHNVPDFSATETDESGAAFFLGLTDGPYTVLATVASTDKEVSRVSVFVEDGTITQVGLAPN